MTLYLTSGGVTYTYTGPLDEAGLTSLLASGGSITLGGPSGPVTLPCSSLTGSQITRTKPGVDGGGTTTLGGGGGGPK